ncbi:MULTISPECIES: metallophosphoesterase family protein [Paraburkholderia]|uniref:metallophosphoesterase family protein n=1 Tax=Paraburkholderia TaxID=1822464 RepID=UPI003218D175
MQASSSNQGDVTLTVALLSDPHFYAGTGTGEPNASWLQVVSAEGPKFKRRDNPWASLLALVKNHGLTADVLLCPGDITTYADPVGLHVAWKCLVTLGDELKASLTASATGNHDVTSRALGSGKNVVRDLNDAADLFENLKQLEPAYPVHISTIPPAHAHERRVHYFGADYVLVDNDPRYRLVVFNSCARHNAVPVEYERGRIAESALSWLDDALERSDGAQTKMNLFVCHHHPIQHEDHHLGSYDFMQNGQRLLDTLSKHGDWIVFHGHKHHGKLTYAPGGASPPVVFAASSFGAVVDDASLRLRNQFYLIDIVLPSGGGSPLGTVRAWNWYLGSGWKQSDSTLDGIYTGCGFGERGHPDKLADAIAQMIPAPTPWANIISNVPWLRHVTPRDMKSIERSLLRRHNIVITSNVDGKYEEAGRKRS